MKKTAEEEEQNADNLVSDDFQLYEALNLLKGLSILDKKES